MNFKEYVNKAIRTESLFQVIDDNHDIHSDTDGMMYDSLFHSAIGIQTEVGEIFEALFIKEGEIDEVNLREEIGDVMWYVAIACKKLDYYEIDFDTSFDAQSFSNYTDCAYKINYQSIELLDSFKKALFYNKPLDTELLKERLYEIFLLGGAFVELLGGNLQSICEINIEKLQARYPEKFSTEKAINRDLKTERNILES